MHRWLGRGEVPVLSTRARLARRDVDALTGGAGHS
jgi:hypothetical protein